MELTRIIELLSYTLPAIVTGVVAYFFFMNHTNNEEKKLKLEILKLNQKQSLPLKLQAYERMTLFLERINPSKLLLRVNADHGDTAVYVDTLISTIEQEFEHNMAQQIYLSEECWNVIIAAKNATSHIIKKTAERDDVNEPGILREEVIKQLLKSGPPTTAALTFIKEEVKGMI
jgi:hypothetical protein